jgi:hypothetical protein
VTPAQRARRLRQINARREALNAELRELDREAHPLELEHSRSLGYSFPPQRGRALIAIMDRLEGRAA